MIRFVALALLAFLLFLVIRSAIATVLASVRGTARAGGGPRALRNELVKDPVCETYVPRRTAIARSAGQSTYYFCSPACAEKFRLPS